jgi:hypothetical protein
MSLLDRPYTTLDRVKAILGIKLSDISKDETIELAINDASRFIDDATGMVFYKQTLTNFYLPVTGGGGGFSIYPRSSQEGGGIIKCPWRPIISIQEIVELETALVENTDFFVDLVGGRIERADGQDWERSPRAIKISGTFGYNATTTTAPAADIPGSILRIAGEFAARMSGLYHRDVEQSDGTKLSLHESTVPKWMVDRLESMAMGL